jgi:hypothetical protein
VKIIIGSLLVSQTYAPEARLILNGRNILFVNHVKHLGVIFDRSITWRLHIETTEVKPSEHSLEYTPCLSANIKPALHKALIKIVMTYAGPTCKLAADIYHVKLRLI